MSMIMFQMFDPPRRSESNEKDAREEAPKDGGCMDTDGSKGAKEESSSKRKYS